MNVLGLKIRGHDTGAAVISGTGKIVAIAEERLNRVKHSPNMFPILSIRYCLEGCGLLPKDVDLIVIDQVGLRGEIPMREIFENETGDQFFGKPVEVINHHDAHAASAFFASPFEESAILVCDGAGERFEISPGIRVTESDTLYYGKSNSIKEIKKISHLRRDDKEYPCTFGIGKLYTLFSETYLGLGKYNEGKMMGLAPYGSSNFLKKHPLEEWCKEVNGDMVCNSVIRIPARSIWVRAKNIFYWSRARSYFRGRLKVLYNYINTKFFGFSKKVKSTSASIFSPLYIPCPPRSSRDILPDEYYSSVAYAVQKVLEHVTISLAKEVRKMTGSKNLAVAGGVGLNIDANKKYLDEAGFTRLFVQPAASDTGIPLGCALYGYHILKNQPRLWTMKSASLGVPYADEVIDVAIKKRRNEIKVIRLGMKKSEHVARLIAKGSIIGWFHGGAEYGPRALGNRSILCDARHPDMRDILNSRVKHREMWRPFAASVLSERVKDYFESDIESPFMLVAVAVRKEKQKNIPSVTHVDGTCRIQSVTREANEAYYDLINAFYRQTGCPLVLNTSFNLGGEPIVETPSDAIDSFLRTHMDYLVIEDYLIQKV